MELIDTEQRARRLARAVATDIVLYNEQRLSAGADLSREIEEGRSHFCARVAPSLHWVFEEVLAGTPLGTAARPTSPQPAPKPVQVKPASVASSPAVREPPSSARPAKIEPRAVEANPPPVASTHVSRPAPEPARFVAPAPVPVPPRVPVERSAPRVPAPVQHSVPMPAPVQYSVPMPVEHEATPRLPVEHSAPLPVEHSTALPVPIEASVLPATVEHSAAPPVPAEYGQGEPAAARPRSKGRLVALLLCMLGFALAIGWLVRR